VKIGLYYIGKPRSREANLLADEYAKRIAHFCRFEMVEVKSEKAMPPAAKAFRVVLDPAGRMMTSEGLAELLEAKSGEIHFCIGGAEGFSDAFCAEADALLSLSKMTLPHELARVVLAEQVYRAFTILRNHPYPR
jgi:23S rRNA (pseudouridine1915-N3)-methyltransferase